MNARTCIVNSQTSKTPGPVRVSRNIYPWDGSRTQTHISKLPGPWQMSRSLYTCLKMVHGFKPTSVNSLIIDRCLETFALARDGSRIQTHISKFPGPWQMFRNLYTCLRWITDSNPHQCSSEVNHLINPGTYFDIHFPVFKLCSTWRAYILRIIRYCMRIKLFKCI
jgi:hypothetical protein